MKAAEQQQSYQDNQVKPQITYHKELKLYTIRYFYPVKLFNRAEIRLITDGVPIKKVTCFKNRENKILIEKEHPWKIKKKIENGYRETPKEKKEQKNYLLVSSRDSFFENCQQRFEELYNQSQESLNTLTNNLSKMIKSFSP